MGLYFISSKVSISHRSTRHTCDILFDFEMNSIDMIEGKIQRTLVNLNAIFESLKLLINCEKFRVKFPQTLNK